MKTLVQTLAGLGLIVLMVSAAAAQSPSRAGYNLDPKVLGYTFGSGMGSSQLYRQHAANHAQVLQHHAKSGEPLSAEMLKEHASEARRNLDKSFAEMEKIEANIKNDKAAMTLLNSIKAIHKNAAEACTMLETECAKKAADKGAVADCCTDMAKQLEAATLLHEQLLKHLGTKAGVKK